MRIIQQRKLTLVNTDPQRRCYNGCHFSSELVWTEWGDLEIVSPTMDEEERLKFWRELSAYAVSQLGESATSEYRVVEKETYE